MAKQTTKTAETAANLAFETKRWAAADALRSNMAAEYRHIVLGLIVLEFGLNYLLATPREMSNPR